VLKIVENLWAVGAPPEPRWGAHSAPPDPVAGVKGACCPSPHPKTLTQSPLLSAFSLAFQPFCLGSHAVKYPGHALERVAVQVCRAIMHCLYGMV